MLEASPPIDDIVEQYPAMLSQGIREGLKQRGQVPPMVADTVGYVVSSSFSADKIEQQIITDLQAQLTDEQLQAVSEWYQTPVARKISSAEIAASAPEAWPQIQASAPELNRKYKGTPKAEMFDRFDRAARATESAVDTTIAVQLGGLATAMSRSAANQCTMSSWSAVSKTSEECFGGVWLASRSTTAIFIPTTRSAPRS